MFNRMKDEYKRVVERENQEVSNAAIDVVLIAPAIPRKQSLYPA